MHMVITRKHAYGSSVVLRWLDFMISNAIVDFNYLYVLCHFMNYNYVIAE